MGERDTTTKCESCGRFISYAEMAEGGGAKVDVTPDSHFGPERIEWTCPACITGEAK